MDKRFQTLLGKWRQTELFVGWNKNEVTAQNAWKQTAPEKNAYILSRTLQRHCIWNLHYHEKSGRLGLRAGKGNGGSLTWNNCTSLLSHMPPPYPFFSLPNSSILECSPPGITLPRRIIPILSLLYTHLISLNKLTNGVSRTRTAKLRLCAGV